MHNTLQKPSFPFLAHWLSLCAGICLAACVQSPQAAVSTQAPHPMAKSWDTAMGECAGDEPLRKAAARVDEELQGQGMALRIFCQASQGALAVQVDVVDGLRASKVVRGPLAEGEAVDMGAPAGVSSTPSANDHADFSPDVQHNRQWLRALMARHQFAHLPDAWWHFAYQPAQQSAVAEVDVAER